jgi:glycyl-tRNA synthetase beta chain
MTTVDQSGQQAQDLLVELGCEELPPKALDGLREAFFKSVTSGLEKQNITYDATGSRSFSSPRRLALLIRNVAPNQADQRQERRGPALKAAFDEEGKPTGAAIGFARSVNKPVSELQTIRTDKGEWLFAELHIAGKSLTEIIYPLLEQAIKNLPVPKPMRWGDSEFSFVRPVHWLIVLHGQEVLPGSLLGQNAGNTTRGHRVHSPGPHRVKSAGDYVDTLEAARVIADQDHRRNLIREKLLACCESVHIDAGLLNEVNNLLEWPVAVECTFDAEFLAVPHAALIASMQDHQKFFPIMESSDSNRISNRFVALSNLESTHPPSVRQGYERVIRPRLADARFFMEQDLKVPLAANIEALDRIVFQQKIGSIGDKSRRMADISRNIAELIGVSPDHCARAAMLAKCDLLTQMVGEFPELQGVMGQQYALASGERPDVAEAIEQHYAPRFAGDVIPASDIGQVISISDRLDTLVGIFAAGLRPSGNKDPFALRRAALGLVRILLEAKLELPLTRLLALASTGLRGQLDLEPGLLQDLREFVTERTRHFYHEKGFATELINAAVASDWDTLPDLDSRLTALDAFMGQEAATSLAASNKRIGNILRKSEVSVSQEIDTDLLVLEEERVLFAEVESMQSRLEPLLEDADYAASLSLLAGLKDPIDRFFDRVMVMDKDPDLRTNRLALLSQLKALFDHIADLSVLG